MHENPVGNAFLRVPLDNRLQAAGIIVAGHAKRRITAALVDAEAGVVDAAAGLRAHPLAGSNETVPHTRGAARPAACALGILGGEERAAFHCSHQAQLTGSVDLFSEDERVRIGTEIILGSVRIDHHIVTGIAQAVTINVVLARIRNKGAIVHRVQDPIIVIIVLENGWSVAACDQQLVIA